MRGMTRPWCCKSCSYAREKYSKNGIHACLCAEDGHRYGNVVRCPHMTSEEEPMENERESFEDMVNVLRKAAMGDFPGATGAVTENFLVLMGRGGGDSLAGAFDELADRLEEAHNRELARLARGCSE